MNGDLLVFGGSATIEEGATVNGSVVLFGGNLTVKGTVNGDVAITGGSVTPWGLPRMSPVILLL